MIPLRELDVVNAGRKRDEDTPKKMINYLGEGRSVVVNPWDVVVARL